MAFVKGDKVSFVHGRLRPDETTLNRTIRGVVESVDGATAKVSTGGVVFDVPTADLSTYDPERPEFADLDKDTVAKIKSMNA